MRMISPAELNARITKGENIMVIDIREPEKFEAGHLPASVNIFQKNIPQHIDKISRTDMVVIACTYGMKSDQVYLYLREKHKFKNLWILEGGIYDYACEFAPHLNIL